MLQISYGATRETELNMGGKISGQGSLNSMTLLGSKVVGFLFLYKQYSLWISAETGFIKSFLDASK